MTPTLSPDAQTALLMGTTVSAPFERDSQGLWLRFDAISVTVESSGTTQTVYFFAGKEVYRYELSGQLLPGNTLTLAGFEARMVMSVGAA